MPWWFGRCHVGSGWTNLSSPQNCLVRCISVSFGAIKGKLGLWICFSIWFYLIYTARAAIFIRFAGKKTGKSDQAPMLILDFALSLCVHTFTVASWSFSHRRSSSSSLLFVPPYRFLFYKILIYAVLCAADVDKKSGIFLQLLCHIFNFYFAAVQLKNHKSDVNKKDHYTRRSCCSTEKVGGNDKKINLKPIILFAAH